MILTSNASASDVQQAEPDPRFLVGTPRLNPLAASAPLSITKHLGSVAIGWSPATSDEGDREEHDLVSRLIERSRREVMKRPSSARAHSNLGIALLNAGQLTGAAAEFESALRIDPKHYVAATSLARIKVEMSDLSGAEQIYQSLRSHYPNTTTPVLSLAQIAMRKQDYKSAEVLLREAIGMGHKAITARYHLGMILLKLGRKREAIAEFRSALRNDVRSPFLYEGLGIAYLLNGSVKRAIASFKTALALAPQSKTSVHNLSIAYLDSHEPEKATDLLISYLEGYPDDMSARELLGRAYQERKLHKSAIGQWTNVFVEIEHTQSTDINRRACLANNIGAAYLDEGELTQSETWLLRSIGLAPNFGPLPYNNLARVCLQGGDNLRAAEILRGCTRLFPDERDTKILLAVAYVRLGHYDGAIDVLRAVVDSGKGTQVVYADLGYLLADARRDYKASLEILREGYEKFSQDGLLVNNLAYTYLMCKDVQSARQLLEKHVHLLSADSGLDGPSRSVLNATWGLLHVLEGDLEGGEQLYRSAYALASKTGDRALANGVLQKMHLEIARALLAVGDRSGAGRHLRIGLDIRRGRELYEQDLRQLADKVKSDG
jgi:tetratricopeptide (TPR) repeat protein